MFGLIQRDAPRFILEVSIIRILLGLIVILAVLLSGVPHVVNAASTIYVPCDTDGQVNGTLADPGGLAVRQLFPAITTQPTPARMSLQYLNIYPKQAYPDEPVTIAINVVNSGDVAGQIYVEVKINDQKEQSRLVGVGPQTTMPLKFTVIKTEPGIYNVDVGGNRGRFTILAANGNTGSTNLSNGLIALLIGTLIIAAVMVILMAFIHPA